jgi:peptidoglycan glycosyltransferase
MGDTIMSAETASVLRNMMLHNVVSDFGAAYFSGLTVGAKTGTAQVGTDSEPHAWLVGFVADEDTPYVFAVIVENSGSGRVVAGEVARRVFSVIV